MNGFTTFPFEHILSAEKALLLSLTSGRLSELTEASASVFPRVLRCVVLMMRQQATVGLLRGGSVSDLQKATALETAAPSYVIRTWVLRFVKVVADTRRWLENA